MSHFVFCATLLVAALLPDASAAAPLSLAAALDLAVQRSAAAGSARAGLLSASEAARAAARLPDPTLRIGVDNLPVTGPDRLHTARDSMTMKRIGISQEWLSGDKRAARQTAADAVVERQSVQALVAAADARLQTALAYVDAVYAEASLHLTAHLEQHAREEVETARARLASASGAGHEVLLASAARGQAEDESAELRQQLNAAQVTLQRWVGAPVDVLEPAPAFAAVDEAGFVQRNPVVVGLERDIDVARSAAAVTASERRPNWTFEAAYGQRTGYSDMLSVGVSIPLALAPGERQDRDTASRLALVAKAEADLVEATRAATAEYRMLAGDAERLQLRIARYRAAVLEPAGQRIAAATAGYRSNQAGLGSVFEARHAELEARRKLLLLERDLARRQAQLAYRPVAPGVSR